MEKKHSIVFDNSRGETVSQKLFLLIMFLYHQWIKQSLENPILTIKLAESLGKVGMQIFAIWIYGLLRISELS